jgi:hypothetical protein
MTLLRLVGAHVRGVRCRSPFLMLPDRGSGGIANSLGAFRFWAVQRFLQATAVVCRRPPRPSSGAGVVAGRTAQES